MKKIISLLLAVLTAAGVFMACDSKKDEDKKIPDSAQTGTEAAGTQAGSEESAGEAQIEPDLPEGVDYGGYTFTFLAHLYEGDDWLSSLPLELVAEEQSGEPVNDAVYKRNLKIKERYNIDIKMTGDANEMSAVKKAVGAGDGIYDAVLMFNNNVPGIASADLLTNIDDLPYVDLAKPWWDPALNAMSVDGKNFLLAGDLLILDNEATNVLLFNKDLMATLAMELPYGLVNSGKWTMDKFNEYIKGAAGDLNGDGSMSPADDRWGFVAFNDTLHALLVGGGGALAVKDENDLPHMDFTSPRNLTVIEKSMDIMYNKSDVLNIQADIPASATWTEMYVNSFEQNRALFIWVRMRIVEKFRNMESNFGIIPMPKFDENQEKYYSVVNPYTGALIGVPKSAEDLERVSIILEALSAESRYTLQPAYYDVVLQRKYARDEESSEMLDIIFNSRIYDIGAVYSFGNAFVDFIGLCNKSDRNVVSYYEKKQGAMGRAIDKVVDIFRSME